MKTGTIPSFKKTHGKNIWEWLYILFASYFHHRINTFTSALDYAIPSLHSVMQSLVFILLMYGVGCLGVRLGACEWSDGLFILLVHSLEFLHIPLWVCILFRLPSVHHAMLYEKLHLLLCFVFQLKLVTSRCSAACACAPLSQSCVLHSLQMLAWLKGVENK